VSGERTSGLFGRALVKSGRQFPSGTCRLMAMMSQRADFHKSSTYRFGSVLIGSLPLHSSSNQHHRQPRRPVLRLTLPAILAPKSPSRAPDSPAREALPAAAASWPRQREREVQLCGNPDERAHAAGQIQLRSKRLGVARLEGAESRLARATWIEVRDLRRTLSGSIYTTGSDAVYIALDGFGATGFPGALQRLADDHGRPLAKLFSDPG
jgi:hypothetical protein